MIPYLHIHGQFFFSLVVFAIPFFLSTNFLLFPLDFLFADFRIVRFPISDSSFETVITNLDSTAFPASELIKLYAMR